MATVTANVATSTATDAFAEDDEPKYRIEHSISDMATCQQAAHKREGMKLERGELRVGIWSFFEPEEKYIRRWRHWGCVTKKQIKTIKELAGGDPTKVPGYDSVSAKSQEQVRLAFEEEAVVDKDFKDIRVDLSKFARDVAREILNAVGYKVEVTQRGSASCQNGVCKTHATKIGKGELRLGIMTLFLGEHESWRYRHWRCISKLHLRAIRDYHEQKLFEGVEDLPEEYKTAVLESLKKDEIVVPSFLEPQPAKKAKKQRKKKVDTDTEEDQDEEVLPKPTKKIQRSRKADIDTEEAEREPVRYMTRSRKKMIENNDGEEHAPKKKNKKRAANAADADEDGKEEPVAPKPKRKKRSR